eukprot:760444-Hanusia_phi.AAC.9
MAFSNGYRGPSSSPPPPSSSLPSSSPLLPSSTPPVSLSSLHPPAPTLPPSFPPSDSAVALAGQEEDNEQEGGLDVQELIVEVLQLKGQLRATKERNGRLEEENNNLRSQVATLEAQSQAYLSAHRKFEEEAKRAEHYALQATHIDEDEDMRGLKEGEEGYQEARIKVLEKRVIAMAKNDCWMRAQVEQAKDQAADARRRQGLPRTIPSRAARCAGEAVHVTLLSCEGLSLLCACDVLDLLPVARQFPV